MKKTLSIILGAILFISSLTSCGGTSDTQFSDFDPMQPYYGDIHGNTSVNGRDPANNNAAISDNTNLTAADVIKKASNALKSTTGFKQEITNTVDISDSHSDTTIFSETDNTAGLQHYFIENDDSIEIWSHKNNDTYDEYVYSQKNKKWTKCVNLPRSFMSVFIVSTDLSLDGILLFIDRLAECGTLSKTADGYVIQGDVKIDDEIITAIGFKDWLYPIIKMSTNTPPDAEAFGTVEITVTVDDETFLISKLKIDKEDAYINYGRILQDLSSETNSDIDLDALEIEYSVTSEFYDYNKVKLTLPKEAENAEVEDLDYEF